MGDLYRRLQTIREREKRAPAKAPPQVRARPVIDGWTRRGDFVLSRTLHLDLPEGVVGRLGASEFGIGPDDCFMDTETTGLQTGTGTVAFLVGWARFVGVCKLEVTQLFLEDFPGEPLLLESMAVMLGPDSRLVSYNGASFDMPLLRSRFAMNGIRMPDWAHLDYLHPSRRLFKSRFDSCSLSYLEAQLLGRPRSGDIPGELIPERWFSWLRGEGPGLDDVFHHHVLDLQALAELACVVNDYMIRPLEPRVKPTIGPDPWGQYRSLFRTTVPMGIAPAQDEGEVIEQLLLRSWEEDHNFRAARELLIEFGFRRRDFARALRIARRIEATMGAEEEEFAELTKRIARLDRFARLP